MTFEEYLAEQELTGSIKQQLRRAWYFGYREGKSRGVWEALYYTQKCQYRFYQDDKGLRQCSLGMGHEGAHEIGEQNVV